MSESEREESKVKLRANGDLIITEDGTVIVVANYDKKTGTLEFATRGSSVKFYNQAVARITTVAGGTQPSQYAIRSITIKGEAGGVAKNAPKRPKLGPLGDAAEDIVQWYLDNHPAEAIARYGIYTDEKGEFVRKTVRRRLVNIVDRRNEDTSELEAVKQGVNSQSKGPVNFEGEIVEVKNAIIARRATALTYSPNEVVGGYQPDEQEYEKAATEDQS